MNMTLLRIIIQKSDKGNSVVLMKRDYCSNQMEILIPDQAKFQILSFPGKKDYTFMVKEKKVS